MAKKAKQKLTKAEKRIKKADRERNKEKAPLQVGGYHTRPFALLHTEYLRSAPCSKSPHEIRSRFWQFVPPQEYQPDEARELLKKYLISLEDEIASILSQHSIAYWLHLYRRLSPGSIGDDTQPVTIGLTRAVLEAAIQKYAQPDLCERVGFTKDVPIESVLGGILMAPQFKPERDSICQNGNQLVLTSYYSP